MFAIIIGLLIFSFFNNYYSLLMLLSIIFIIFYVWKRQINTCINLEILFYYFLNNICQTFIILQLLVERNNSTKTKEWSFAHFFQHSFFENYIVPLWVLWILFLLIKFIRKEDFKSFNLIIILIQMAILYLMFVVR